MFKKTIQKIESIIHSVKNRCIISIVLFRLFYAKFTLKGVNSIIWKTQLKKLEKKIKERG